jgi:hypothetical protein
MKTNLLDVFCGGSEQLNLIFYNSSYANLTASERVFIVYNALQNEGWIFSDGSGQKMSFTDKKGNSFYASYSDDEFRYFHIFDSERDVFMDADFRGVTPQNVATFVSKLLEDFAAQRED